MAAAKNDTFAGAAEDNRTLADDLKHMTGSEADAARIASGQPQEDATEAVEAEVPAENIAHISDARLPTREEQAAAMDASVKAAGTRK